MWRRLSDVLDRFYVIAGYGAGVLLVGLCGMILYSVVGRMLGLYLGGVNDFAGYVMATSTFMALSYTFRTGGHIRVALLLNSFTGQHRRSLETFCLVSMAAVISYFAFYMCRLVWFSYDFQERSDGADATLLWIPQTPVAIGAILFAVAVLHQLIETLFDYERVNPETSSNEGVNEV
jgi:TRAP-type C4-dicarboxylate transport system permease small subunit